MKTDRALSRHPATSPPTSTRPGLALAALALGGLAIGTTEFASMGLLPQFTADLSASIPQGGAAISAYAIGVVVGAPALAVAGARWPRKRLVLALTAALVLTNASSAFAPSFETFVATRFLSGLPHGAYFGTAAVLGASLLPRARRARAVASTLAGLMIANVVGVPLATWLGQALGWPAAYLAVAGIALLTLVAVAVVVPDVREARPQSIRRELSAFGRPQVWATMLVIAVGYGGTFAVYSYITPILTTLSGFTEGQVPLVLASFGVAMTVGNSVGGRLAERAPVRTIAIGMAMASAALAAFVVTAHSAPGAVLTLLALAFATTATSPALATRLMDAAPDGPTLGAACHHSAFNVANAFGAAMGGLILAAGLGYGAAAAAAALMPLAGLLALAGSVAIERRAGRRRPVPAG